MTQENHCPKCYKRGVCNPLIMLDCSMGKIQNLCPDPCCRYPFSSYMDLPQCITLSRPKSDVENATDLCETDCGSMEDFLAELWGCNKDVDLDAPPSAPGVESAQETRKQKTSVKKRRRISSEVSRTSVSHPDTEVCCSSRIDPELAFPVSDVTFSYMLPRYLADDVKRATNSLRHSSPVSFKSLRNAYGSCDSGISVVSNSTANSVRTCPVERADTAQRPNTLLPVSSVRTPNPSAQHAPPPSPQRSSSEAHATKPLLQVERMINLYKKRYHFTRD